MSAIPNEELPILEALINIRNRLTALKKDRSEYIRAQDVMQIYQAVIKQVTKLNAVRDELQASVAAGPGGREGAGEVDSAALTATNRVDTTLNDVFALLSLFFLTIGKSRESPALFSQLGCMKQLLDHLSESGIYTESDLQPFAQRLAELRAIISRDSDGGKHPPQLTKLMMRKLEGCERALKNLQGTLSVLSVELVPIHQRLVATRRQLAAAAAKPKPSRAEIKVLQEELRKIDSKRVDGKFLGPGGSSVPAGQAILVGILEECFEICHDITVRNDEVPMTLQPIYDRLSEIKGQLEHLVLTHRWTLRETDLWNFQVSLKEIDRLRVNGKFVDSEGKQPEGQLILLYLLRRCYGLIYRLVASSEPISEELMPISNKLSTVSKCLKEVSKYGGPFTMRDLYPYRLALHQIDGMRSPLLDKDGNDTGVKKWLGRDGSVPEGQAILRAQYEEVEQTIEEMMNREEDDEDEDEDEDDYSVSGSELSEDDIEMGTGSNTGVGTPSVSGDMEDRSLGVYSPPSTTAYPDTPTTAKPPPGAGAGLADATTPTPTSGFLISQRPATLPVGAAPVAVPVPINSSPTLSTGEGLLAPATAPTSVVAPGLAAAEVEAKSTRTDTDAPAEMEELGKQMDAKLALGAESGSGSA